MIARFSLTLALMAVSAIAIGQETTSNIDSQPTQDSQAASATEAKSESTPPANSEPTAKPEAPANPPSADPPSGATVTEPNGDSQTEKPVDTTVEAPADVDASKLKDLLSLVQDNTLAIHKRENPAYFQLLKSVLDRTPEQLQQEVTLNPRFNDLYKKPSEYRGQLVHLELNARRVLPVDIKSRNAAGVTRLYEIWGWTQEAKAWMYCCVVPELPEGFPEEGDIVKRIELTGYFFKMQAYQPGNAAPNARNLVAPLIIGRIVDAGPVQAKTGDSIGNWPLYLIIGFGIIVMFRIMLHLRGMGRTTPIRRNYRRRSLEPIDPDALDDAIPIADRGIRIRNANEV